MWVCLNTTNHYRSLQISRDGTLTTLNANPYFNPNTNQFCPNLNPTPNPNSNLKAYIA